MNGNTYGPRPGLAFALIVLVIIGLAFGEQIEAFVSGLAWNAQVAIIGTVAAALGIAAVAALLWRPQ